MREELKRKRESSPRDAGPLRWYEYVRVSRPLFLGLEGRPCMAWAVPFELHFMLFVA